MECVYFIFQNGTDDKCKIGSTKRSIDQRVSELQTGNPDKLYVYRQLYTINHKQWETYLHFTLKFKHIDGEWYNLTKKDVDCIHDTFSPFCTLIPPLFNSNGITEQNLGEKKKKRKTYTTEDHIHVIVSGYICGKCNQPFKSRKYLERHKEKNIPCDYKCGSCGKKLSERGYYKHIKNRTCL